MDYRDFVKKYAALPLLFISTCVEASSIGIVGGTNMSSMAAPAALIAPTAQPLLLTGLPSTARQLLTVSINSSSQGLIGGNRE